MLPETERVLRREIRARVTAKDFDGLNGIAWEAGLAGLSDDYSEIAHEEIAAAAHDVQLFWMGSCNCHGQLN